MKSHVPRINLLEDAEAEMDIMKGLVCRDKYAGSTPVVQENTSGKPEVF